MRSMAASQRFLFVVLCVLLLAFAGIGTIQYRQFQDLQRSTSQGEDNVMWNYFQLYNEALRFQSSLLHESQPTFQLRYDILVSRMDSVLESKDCSLLQQTEIYQQASKAIRSYISLADIWLGRKPPSRSTILPIRSCANNSPPCSPAPSADPGGEPAGDPV